MRDCGTIEAVKRFATNSMNGHRRENDLVRFLKTRARAYVRKADQLAAVCERQARLFAVAPLVIS